MHEFHDTVFFIGAGSMSEAIIRGITEKRAVAPENMYVSNRNHPERLAELQRLYGICPASDLSALRDCRVVFLTAKPGDCEAALAQALPYLNGQLVISVAAGVTLDYLRQCVKDRATVIRSMPNIPVAVLEGSTAVSFPEGIGEQDKEAVKFLLRQVGDVVDIPESLMDAATAFTGSGPGFVCYFLEAMEDAAVELGFDPSMARRQLLQTVIGTARTLSEWGLSPKDMRERVTSPNGTTFAGITKLQEGDLYHTVSSALHAAARRSREMANTYSVKPDGEDG